MNTEKMTKTITEVLDAKDAVDAFLDEIELTEAQHKQAIAELEQELAGHNEALGMAEDLGQAGLIRQQIKDTKEQIELVKMVNENKVRTKYQILADMAESFFAVHKDAGAKFDELDKVMLATTGLGALKDNMELMQGFANTLNFSFAGVRQILLDTGIVPMSEQNLRYRGKYHLGQRGLLSELNSFNAKVAGYVRDLKYVGKL